MSLRAFEKGSYSDMITYFKLIGLLFEKEDSLSIRRFVGRFTVHICACRPIHLKKEPAILRVIFQYYNPPKKKAINKIKLK